MEQIRVPGQRLGRIPSPPEHRERNLRLARYLPTLPAAPATLDLTGGITAWPMFLNDHLGDCTCAAAAHMLEVWGQQVDGTPKLVTDQDVLAFYERQGYVPGDAATDQGACETNVLETWRSSGLAGDTLYAYAEVDVSQHDQVRAAARLFGGLYIGILLPIVAQSQSVWDAVPGPLQEIEPDGWGGHAVNVVGYDAAGLTIVTWGAVKRMTWGFWDAYVDEAYACLPSDYDRLAGRALANGFNEAQLREDLLAFGAVDL